MQFIANGTGSTEERRDMSRALLWILSRVSGAISCFLTFDLSFACCLDVGADFDFS